jgi:hypothetical protein
VIECFRIADDADWNLLKDSTVSIAMPTVSDEFGLEAYEPLSFSIESSDPRANASFMLHHNVSVAWKFVLTRNGQAPASNFNHLTLDPKAVGPWVTQYFPYKGRVWVSAQVNYKGETITVPRPADGEKPAAVQPLEGPAIADTSDFSVFDTIAFTDYIAWGIAAAGALVTGISTIYLKSTGFGSWQDYLLLFLWGIGADQGKNLIQGLQAFSPTVPAARR